MYIHLMRIKKREPPLSLVLPTFPSGTVGNEWHGVAFEPFDTMPLLGRSQQPFGNGEVSTKA